MKYQKTLVDSLGFTHPRKNQYIVDLIEESEGKKPKKYNKADHPYNKKLNIYKKDEKVLLEVARKEAHDLSRIDVDQNKIISLQERFYRASRMFPFYEENSYLTYDAEFKAKVCKLEIDEIPRILAHEIKLTNELKQSEKELKNLTYGEIEQKEAERKKRKKKERPKAKKL